MRRLLRSLVFVSSLACLGGGLAPALAQPAQDAAAAAQEERATSFRAVSGSEAEEVPGGTLMIAAYGLIWLFLMLYLHRIGRLSAGVRADVERLSGLLDERGGPGGEG